MLIHTLKVGSIDTNCYIIEDESSKEALVIDPGDDAEKILKLIKERRLKPRFMVITHGHFDHMGANRELKNTLKIPLLMHEKDTFGLAVVNSPLPDNFLIGGEEIKFGNSSFKVIHNPGHTPGGISLYCEKEKVLFSGDTLFYRTWGRTDLPYSSQIDMIISLKKLLKLPSETKVYPGHGKPTTIGDEQKLLAEL